MSIVENIRAAVKAIKDLTEQPIVVNYRPGSRCAGQVAGHLMKNEKGEPEFIPNPQFEPNLEEVEFRHSNVFETVADALGWLDSKPVAIGSAELWVRGDAVDVVVDRDHPGAGGARVNLRAHADHERWAKQIRGETVELSHADLAELLSDYRGMLGDPGLASMISSLRAATSVEYTGELDTTETSGIMTKFSAKGQAGALDIPRDLEVRLASHAGIWAVGKESRIPLKLTLRAKSNGAGGVSFRIASPYARIYNELVLENLRAGVRELAASSKTKPAVYSGSTDSARYVLG